MCFFLPRNIKCIMKPESVKKHSSITLKNIFMHMMENGYEPSFEENHIQFGIGEDTAVVQYEEGIMSVRLFYSIDEDEYDLFLEASNMTMLKTYAVKAAVLDNMTDLLFSCEFLCDDIRDFRRYLPMAVDMLKKALKIHKEEMRKLIIASGLVSTTIPAADVSTAGIGKRKIIS